MKKTRWFCSLLMTLVLVLSSMSGLLTITASAAEVDAEPNEMITEEELNALAQELFPEKYQAALNVAQSGIATYSDCITVVNTETRNISDTERLTFLEMSDGQAALAYDVYFPSNSTIDGGTYVTSNVDIMFSAVGYSGAMRISGFDFTIYTSGYDKINDPGYSCGTSTATRTHWFKDETSSRPATVAYTVPFESYNIDGLIVYFYFYAYVGNNRLTYDVNHS